MILTVFFTPGILHVYLQAVCASVTLNPLEDSSEASTDTTEGFTPFEFIFEEARPPSPPAPTEIPLPEPQSHSPLENDLHSPPTCLSRILCSRQGNFARCSSCVSQYFHCERPGREASVQRCPGFLLFNPVPTLPLCVPSTGCPRTPGPGESTIAPPPDGPYFPFGKCKDSFECIKNGRFPRCPTCNSSYFSCNDGNLSIYECPGLLVFSPDPHQPYCMLKESCFSYLRSQGNTSLITPDTTDSFLSSTDPTEIKIS